MNIRKINKVLVLGCVALFCVVGVFSLKVHSSDALEAMPKKEVLPSSQMQNNNVRHVYIDPLETHCRDKYIPLDKRFKANDLIFTGTVVQIEGEERIQKYSRQGVNFVGHSTVPISTFKIDDLIKTPVGFKEKTVKIKTTGRDIVGEKYIVYARLVQEGEKKYFHSNYCPHRKYTTAYYVEKLKKRIKENIRLYSSVIFQGKLKKIHETKEEKHIVLEFDTSEIMFNRTQTPNEEMKVIRVFARDCDKNDFYLGQSYIWNLRIVGVKVAGKHDWVKEDINLSRKDGEIPQFAGNCKGNDLFFADGVELLKEIAKKNNVIDGAVK